MILDKECQPGILFLDAFSANDENLRLRNDRLSIGFLLFLVAKLYCFTALDGNRYAQLDLVPLCPADMPNNIDNPMPTNSESDINRARIDARSCPDKSVRSLT